MNLGFSFVLIALGASLIYKGYKGYSWAQFYSVVLGGSPPPAAAAPTSSSAPASTKVAPGAIGSLLAPGIGTLTGKKGS